MSKENKVLLPDGVTEQQVIDWKNTYGEGKLVLASLLQKDVPRETFPAVMHVPGRAVIGEFEKWSDSNPNKAKEILVKGCVLSGIDTIMAPGNDLLFFSAFNACSKLIPKAESELLNL